MSTNLQAIILAAGKSTRFNTGKTKLLEKICGQHVILYPTKLFEKMHIPTTVVVGYQKELIEEVVAGHHKGSVRFAVQQEQEGTGHAILCARDSWQEENILIMNGDMPLVTPEIIESLFKKHRETHADISFVIAHNADPAQSAYGRVIKTNEMIEIKKEHEIGSDSAENCCINAGIYIVTKEFLEKNIEEIERNDLSKEFYATDLVNIASSKGCTVSTISAPFDRVRGINTLQELWAAEQVKRSELIKYWMEKGVRFSAAQGVHINLDVVIGSGTTIGFGVHLLNGTHIGNNCTIGEFTMLNNAQIADNVKIYSHCVLHDAVVHEGVRVGPFAHVHDSVVCEEDVVVGNFVEISKTVLGSKTKVKHLSYLGQTQTGSNVNIGAGTITCNYDGKQKHKTIIEDNVFIGSNNTIIAPLTIHEKAFTAAGSTLNQNVPKNALAIARARQVNKIGYAQKLRQETDTEKKQDGVIPSTEVQEKEKHVEHFFVAATKTDSDLANIE